MKLKNESSLFKEITRQMMVACLFINPSNPNDLFVGSYAIIIDLDNVLWSHRQAIILP